MKECFKCKVEKPLSDFYKHKQMADGHLNKCKSCAKTDSTKHRGENLEDIRKYDRDRGNRQARGYLKEYRAKYPDKYKAHSLVNNAIRDGKIFKEPCEECQTPRGVAHHDDYKHPFKIRWLCQAHHKQWHAKNGPGLNAE